MDYGKAIVSFCLLAFICLICVISSGNDEIYRYEETSSIDIDNSTEDEVGKVEISDTYTKNGVKYFEIVTTLDGKNKKFTFSEEEYDKYIGLENDAFDCKIYNLTLTSDVIEYSHTVAGKSNLHKINMKYLSEYAKECNLDYYIYEEQYLDERYIHISLNNVTVDICLKHGKNEDNLSTSIQLARYSFIGDKDFSEDEIDKYIEIMDEINRFILDAVDNI